MSHCWMCPSIFSTRKELRSHLDGSHLRLKVVCPWCVDGERSSNRIGDLKKHAINKHGADHLVREGFFSAGVGFYLALYPEDYARVTTPGRPTTEDARAAMNLMRLWMGAVKNPSRTPQDWERGWTLGNATPTREEPSHYIPGSPAVAPVAPPYSPSRPDMISSITVNQVFVKEDCVEVDITHENSYFVASLNSAVKKDTNTVRTIQATIVNTRPRPQGTTTAVKGTLYQNLCERISSETKVGEVFIDHIHMITPTPGRLPLPFPTMTAQQSPQPSATVPTPAIPSPMQSHQPSAFLPPPATIPPPRTPAQQARELLSWGIMPLVPPARRNWDADEVVDLSGRRTSLKWPPRGWRTYTADRKLQVFEYASAMLDADMSGFPVTNRADILDKFNFLALPGSARPAATSKTGMRLGNYQQLRAIAVGKDTDLRILKMLVNAAKDRDCELDSTIAIINAAGIRLRLEK